jgi:serine protease AprX
MYRRNYRRGDDMGGYSTAMGGAGRRTLAAVLAAAVVVPIGLSGVASPQEGPMVPVIVSAAPGQMAAARSGVIAVHGRVVLDLGIIGGFSARVPANAVAHLSSLPAVSSVVPDGAVHLAGKAAAPTTPGAYQASQDLSSLYNLAKTVGADQMWAQHATGHGIGVALIDSGVTPVNGLASGNVVNGPDLSLDAGNAGLRNLDEFGHGTHMAGIIVGRDTGVSTVAGYNDPKNFTGIAPDATLVNVKVGAADGTVDVSQVIAGLDWVVAHHNDAGLNIRVVNLSFGTDSVQDYRIDPLAYAAEAAWRAGIVVVVAAGNQGNQTTMMTDPATDPYVLAVGADDGAYDKNAKKLFVAAFSNAGNASRHPDLVAPGKSVVGLRDPGSLIDVQHPEGLVNDAAARFFRGSGTSQATAIVSGMAALVLSQNPKLTADQVKGVLMANAVPLKKTDPTLQGAGSVSLAGVNKAGDTQAYTQTWATSNGSGSIEAARGGSHVILGGVPLVGEVTVFGAGFDGHRWSNNAWDAASWAGGSWSGHRWSGDAWSGHRWSDTAWLGNSWTSDSWDGHRWSGHRWSSASWFYASWSGNIWF